MIDIKTGHIETLPASGSWPEAVHLFEENSIWAIKAALAAERPLLVRGEPGSGKSQLARAAAAVLNRVFISTVVQANSESCDLQWHFDAVARLAEAQTLSSANADDIGLRLDQRRFLSPGPIWWAFDWHSAQRQFDACNRVIKRPLIHGSGPPENGCVLLIDEIDKADADLPNGLLETLGNGKFFVPYLENPVGLTSDIPRPLVVITTNEERELPAAFLRRCMILHLGPPDDEKEMIDYLMERGKIHFPDKITETVLRRAAEQLWTDRRDSLLKGLQAPGQAEYLDMLRAVGRIAADEEGQLEALAAIAQFALVKYPRESVLPE